MKRRTLDIIFSIGGATLAVLVLVLGLVLRSNAVFAQNYVHDQLSQQQITFTPVAGLSPRSSSRPGSSSTPASHSPRVHRPRCMRTTTSPVTLPR